MTSAENIFGGRMVALCDASDAMLEAVSAAGAREMLVYSRDKRPERAAAPNVYFESYDHLDQVLQNNAEIIALAGRSARVLYGGKGRTTKGRTYCIAASGWSVGFIAALARHYRKGRLKYIGITKLRGMPLSERFWLLFEGRSESLPPRGAYINKQADPTSVFQRLIDLNYVVLREDFPNTPIVSLNDIDLLVNDHDAHKISNILDNYLGWLPVDLFSESPAGGRLYGEVPYYPPHMAHQILSNTTIGPYGEYRPAPRERFLAYCYHLVFHKQAGTWWQDHRRTQEKRARLEKLNAFAVEAGYVPPSDPPGMLDVLSDSGWLPAFDLMCHYAETDTWLAHQIKCKHPSLPPGLCVVVVRDIVERSDLLNTLSESISNAGFEIIHQQKLNRDGRRKAETGIRGGNWKDFPSHMDSGGPVRIIIAVDPNPLPVDERTLKSKPRIDNKRLLRKEGIRISLAARMNFPLGTTFFHASDNSVEALNYIEAIDPALYGQIFKYFTGVPPLEVMLRTGERFERLSCQD